MLLYSALWHWVRQQGVPLFVSMEMNPQLIQERLASMQTHIPLSLIKNGDLDTFRLKKLKGSLKALAKMPQPFHIVDGNLTATVDDLYVLARQLKPSCVYVDGAYLLRLEKSRDRFTRAADNCEALKSRLASELGIPVITSWQFNRNHEKQSKGKASLTDIGYSDAVGQISSICLGLTENDSVETIAKRKVDIMKGRSGETGTFYLKWDFNSMDFGEVDITETNPLAWLS
jgi:replicative DNA helicase